MGELVNFAKNPGNVKDGKYTLKGFTLPTLPFPRVFGLSQSWKATASSSRMKTSAAVRTRGHTSKCTMREKGSYTKLPCAQIPSGFWLPRDRMTTLWSNGQPLLILAVFITPICSSSTGHVLPLSKLAFSHTDGLTLLTFAILIGLRNIWDKSLRWLHTNGQLTGSRKQKGINKIQGTLH